MQTSSTVLNVSVDPILSSINGIVKKHIESSVLDFNLKFIQSKIDEYTQKIIDLEEEKQEIKRLYDTGNMCYASNGTINYNLPSDNIRLDINELPSDTTCKRSPYFEKKIESDKTNKIINIPDVAYDPSIPTGTTSIDSIRFDDYRAETITEKVKEEPEEDDENEQEEEEEDAEGVFEIEVDGVSYYTNNDTNGKLYNMDQDGDPGDEVGEITNGEAFLYEDSKNA